MKSLYEISKELQSIQEYLEEEELTEEIEQSLEITKQELATKTANYLDYIDYLLKEQMRADEAIQQIKEFKVKKQRAIDRLKDNLERAVKQFGPIEVDFKKVSLRKSKSVQIVDEEKLYAVYFKHKVTKSPDKLRIKNAIESGEEVPGAILKENENLTIK